MSVIIFFGFCFVVLTVSTIYVGVAIKHHLEKRGNKVSSASVVTLTKEEHRA